MSHTRGPFTHWNVRLTPRSLNRMRRRSKIMDVPMSWIFRKALSEYLDKLDTEEHLENKEVWPTPLVTDS